MRGFFLASFLVLAGVPDGMAQEDSSSLLKEAGEGLRNRKTTVNAVLTHKKFMSLHPAPAFRAMIRQYGVASPLSIAAEDEPGRKIRIVLSK